MMKNIVYTLLFIPCFAWSQEAILANKIGGQWIKAHNYTEIIAEFMPAESVLEVDSDFIDTSSFLIVIRLHTTDSGKVYYDRIITQVTGLTLRTKYDSHTGTHYLECGNNDCCTGCYKTATGACDCVPTCSQGNCDKRTFGISHLPSGGISNAVRNYLLQ